MPVSKNKQRAAKSKRNPSRKPLKAAVSRGAGTKAKDRSHQKPAGGTATCELCGSVYYDGHWHTAPSLSSAKRKAKRPSADAVLCLQCRLTKPGQKPKEGGYEGIVTFDNLVNLEEKGEIMNLIRHVGNKAMKRDPMDRIITIEDRGNQVVVTTTENQLAVAIGKAVAAAHKGGALAIEYSHRGDLPARVYWKHK